MLVLMDLLRRISLISLMAAVLTLFVCRPLLSLCVHNQGFYSGTIYAANSPGRHQARTLIRQLDSQFQEADSKPHKPHLVYSKYLQSWKREMGVSFMNEPILFACRLASFPLSYTVPLRI